MQLETFTRELDFKLTQGAKVNIISKQATTEKCADGSESPTRTPQLQAKLRKGSFYS